MLVNKSQQVDLGERPKFEVLLNWRQGSLSYFP